MKYTQSKIIYTKSNSKDYRIEFLRSLEEILNEFNFKTKIEGTSIEFERAFRSIPTTGTKRDPFKNLRSGRIAIDIQSINLIKTRSEIDLSHLTFLTLFMGICIFLFGWFWDFNLIGIGIFSIIIMSIVFVIGWISVSGKIDRIIQTAIKKTP